MKLRAQKRGAQQDKGFDSGLNVLFLASFPLVLWFFQGSTVLLITAILEMALLSFGLRLISQGQKRHQAYNQASIAYRPRFPRKVAGSVVIGIVVLVLAGHQFVSLAIPMLLGLVATGLSIAAFGPDPLKNKGMDNPQVVARMEADALVHRSETRMQQLSDRVAALGDADLRLRTEAACSMAVRLVRTLNQDHDQTHKLRKPTEKFAQILETEVGRLETAWDGDDYLFARRRFVAKLDVLGQTYEERLRKIGSRKRGDAFDFEADMLLDRMRTDSTA